MHVFVLHQEKGRKRNLGWLELVAIFPIMLRVSCVFPL